MNDNATFRSSLHDCLWFLPKTKAADAKHGFRDRRKQTIFIDARKLGTLIDRAHSELTDADSMRCRFLSRENESTFTLAA